MLVVKITGIKLGRAAEEHAVDIDVLMNHVRSQLREQQHQQQRPPGSSSAMRFSGLSGRRKVIKSSKCKTCDSSTSQSSTAVGWMDEPDDEREEFWA